MYLQKSQLKFFNHKDLRILCRINCS